MHIYKLKFLWSMFGPMKKLAVVIFFVMLISAFSNSFSLAALLPLLDMLISGENSSFLGTFLRPVIRMFPQQQAILVVVGIVLFFSMLTSLLRLLNVALGAKFRLTLYKRWVTIIFHNYLFAEYNFFINHKQGALMHNLFGATGQAAGLLSNFISFSFQIVNAIFLYILLLIASFKLTVLLTFAFGAIFLFTNKFTKNYATTFGQKQLALSQQGRSIGAESIIAIRQIKTFGLESRQESEFNTTIHKSSKLSLRYSVMQAIPSTVVEFLIISIFGGILFFLIVFSSLEIKAMLPVLGLFVIVSQRLGNSIKSIVQQRLTIYSMVPSLRLVHTLVNQAITQEDTQSGLPFEQLEDDMSIEKVSFAYPGGNVVFKEFDMVLQKGKMTAVIGPSGIGKSTLADLLIRLYVPEAGSIKINGRDIREYNISSWRAKVGFVSQDTFIFNMSIRENILAGKPGATDGEVRYAARVAHCQEFIDRLPDGYNTIVGTRGLKLSGGQRQRIAIARAVIRKPEFYIFDEATSSLDNESEKFIQRSIEEISLYTTILVIAHRLSTIENADVVYDLGQMMA